MSEPLTSVEQFIHSHLESVDQLRTFLLLCANEGESLRAIEVASKLYIPPQAAAETLARLEANGLAASEEDPRRYRSEPRTPEIAEMTRLIVQLDQEKPVTLLNMLYARPKGIQAFPDAFKLRRERSE